MGVTCHSVSGHVIGLDLICSALEGKIHPNITLFHLTHLHTLNLAYNYFFGFELPSQIGGFVNLTHLNLSHCDFEGLKLKETTLKRILQNATGLREIILDGIDMSLIGSRAGPLSLIANMSSSLVTLSLAWTEISASLTNDILCSFPNLQNLNLAGNQDMSICFSKLSCHTSLSTLDLSFCGIQSPISSSFLSLIYLTSLSLEGNHLNGSIPSSLSNLHHLVYLDLSWNDLTGQIPNVFDRLTNLQTLFLQYNNLQGKLPSSLFTLTRLSQLDCSHNQIEGSLPDQVAFSNLTHLSLNDNLLNGTIPGWALSFKSLRRLILSNNRFIGHMNSEITSYSLEYLYLCGNKLEGHFPESIFHLENLTYLCLSSGNWSGIVHFPLFSKLQNLAYLSLSGCSTLLLESEMNVTYTFFNLQTLQLRFNNIIGYSKFSGKFPVLNYLELSNNKLGGKVPKWIHDMHSLVYLNLSHNMLTSIGHHQFPWYYLEYLDLSFNSMDDDISSFFCNITSASIINLSHNRFRGTFPECLANSSMLGELDLQMNKWHGNLPIDTFTYLDQLGTLNLNGNQFRGLLLKSLSNCTNLVDLNLVKGVSTTFAKIPRVFVNIDLSGNKFEGEIPDVIGELQGLKGLNLSHNRLVGHIPHSLANLTNLESLDLSSNMLTGEIPIELTNLNFLEVLNLSQNQLVGSIPGGKQFDTFSNDSYEGNMGLCGLPLSLQCNKNVPQQQYQSSEAAEDKFGFGWKPVAIGYACGMDLGIGLGCCVFGLEKPQWLVIIFDGKWIKRRARITLFSFWL
ncbi:hypothetical protein PIB30_018723 [Stylosanthes scabra]|uniref:Receptor-like protein 12 n=1 Tax=Stylosanthes scabra TaxID=79078 RepID=A0ABU6Y9U6_9FABA|nr:hypothetical protein [Stylosanthes scabra]